MSVSGTQNGALLERRPRSFAVQDSDKAKQLQRRLSLPASAAAANIKSLPVVRLARFHRCSCEDFDGGKSHLSVETKKAELHESSGVAISYTWGEFDRDKRLIGHWQGHPQKEACITLGAEWRVSSFQNRLAQLTEKHGACWIDQFCVPQSDEKIQRTLAAIPSIFSTLPVTALLPGSLCKCLPHAFKQYEAAKLSASHTTASVNGDNLSVTSKALEDAVDGKICLNSNGASSWGTRIWPLEEYFHSTSFTALYVDEERATCFLDNDSEADVGRLNDYLLLLYKKHSDQDGHTPSEAMLAVRDKVSVHYVMLSGLMTHTKRSHDEQIASILLGDSTSPQLLISDPLGSHGSYHLLLKLFALGEMGRSATKDIDYILSAWTRWPEYRIPDDFRTLRAGYLLSDALHQLHRKLGLFIPSWCPAGLLGGLSKTAAWDPRACREGTDIRDSTDIYGVLSFSDGLGSRDVAQIHLKTSDSLVDSLGRRARYFRDWVGSHEGIGIINRFISIAYDWDHLSRNWAAERSNFPSASDVVAMIYSTSPAERIRGLKALISPYLQPTESELLLGYLKHIDILIRRFSIAELEELLYEIVCDVIRVRSHQFRESEVKLVFSQWHDTRNEQEDAPGGELASYSESRTCIGLVNGPLFEQARSSEEGELLTVSTKNTPDIPFYEAVRIPGSLPPEYRVIGIWLPLHEASIKVAEVGAMMVKDEDEHDAFII